MALVERKWVYIRPCLYFREVGFMRVFWSFYSSIWLNQLKSGSRKQLVKIECRKIATYQQYIVLDNLKRCSLKKFM